MKANFLYLSASCAITYSRICSLFHWPIRESRIETVRCRLDRSETLEVALKAGKFLTFRNWTTEFERQYYQPSLLSGFAISRFAFAIVKPVHCLKIAGGIAFRIASKGDTVDSQSRQMCSFANQDCIGVGQVLVQSAITKN